jgi:hypothetical protein
VCGCADDIYREDIVFRDPRNCFKGMKNYQTIFWSLRFHGRLFFNKLYVDVKVRQQSLVKPGARLVSQR